MKELKVFENQNIEIVKIGSEPVFELYAVGQALGYVKIAKGKEYVRKERVDKTIENADIEPVVHNGQQYLTEEMIYDFMFEAKTDKCKVFRKWLSNEVLPSLRQNGYYLTKNADVERLELEVSKLKARNQVLTQENQALRFFDKQITGAWIRINWDLEEFKIGDIAVPMDYVKSFIEKYLNKHGQPKVDRESIQRVRVMDYNLQLSMTCIKSILNSYSNYNISKMCK